MNKRNLFKSTLALAACALYSGTANRTGRANSPNQIAETIIAMRTGRPLSSGTPNSPWMKPK